MPRSSSQAFVTVEHRVLGVTFLGLLTLFAWVTYAVFNKTFTEFTTVMLTSGKAGLQLPENADVKIRGVIVGEVRGAETTPHGVELELGLYPEALSTIPRDATARLLPKTLFGEKYVALDIPASSDGTPIEAGDTIAESRVSIEVEKVLADVYPLLRTVRPEQINYTLTALATALEGRGEAIGENLVVLEDYLRRTNPKIPLLVEDLRKLGAVSGVYRDVLPEVADLLRNSVRTGETFVAKEEKIRAFFSDVAGFSATSRDFLEANGDNIIRLSEQGAAQLPVFEKYAPEYPCLIRSMVQWAPRMENAYRGHTLHINLETIPKQPRGYTAADRPVNGDKRGPADIQDCRDAMNGRYHQSNLPPDRLVPQLQTGVQYPVSKRVAPFPTSTAGASGRQAPDLAALLLEPLTRGSGEGLR